MLVNDDQGAVALPSSGFRHQRYPHKKWTLRNPKNNSHYNVHLKYLLHLYVILNRHKTDHGEYIPPDAMSGTNLLCKHMTRPGKSVWKCTQSQFSAWLRWRNRILRSKWIRWTLANAKAESVYGVRSVI